MAHAINRYKADLREIRFVLFEQLGLADMLGKPPFEGWDSDSVMLAIEQAYRFACEVTGPLNMVADEHGCKLVDGQVVTPPGFIDAWKQLYEAGYKTLATPADQGGQGAPRMTQAVVSEFMSGANIAFDIYSGLTTGAAEVIDHFGTPRQREVYAHRMFNGVWAGTMCLTEPHAGSDVGAATSSAKKNADGTYSIKGTKIFISAGDHDMTENVVHMVLARVEGASAGTKGLSLFIVPKYRVNDDGTLGQRNDVTVAAVEHKMGLHGSATCALQFGDNDACVGELVGEVEHQGMKQMFRLMNYARIGVGLQGLALMSSAYLNALDYARERKQGASIKAWKDPNAPRVAIIEHPDVRRMLVDMKSKVEGTRALVLKLVMHLDRAIALAGKDDALAAYHNGQVELLTPLVKAYSSDQAFRVCETAIQTHGGMGYTRDFQVEQYCRDAKIFSIYEGTNHIQALDLVGRKLGQAGGKHTQEFLGDISKFIEANRGDAELAPSIAVLSKAHEAVAGTAMLFLQWFGAGEMERVPLVANRFLEMMSELAVGWLLLEQAAIAKAKLPTAEEHDKAFYEGKKYSAIYYAQNVLPDVAHKATVIANVDLSPVKMPDAGFGQH